MIHGEGGDEVADGGAGEIREAVAQVKEGGALEPAVPCESGHDDDPDLGGVDEGDAEPPAFGGGQFVGWPDSFDDQKHDGNGGEEQNHAGGWG